MVAKVAAAVLFAGFFAIVFIVVGIRRMLQATKGKGASDSILWGSIGILIGLGFLYGVYWMMTPPPDDHAPLPFDMHAHP